MNIICVVRRFSKCVLCKRFYLVSESGIIKRILSFETLDIVLCMYSTRSRFDLFQTLCVINFKAIFEHIIILYLIFEIEIIITRRYG